MIKIPVDEMTHEEKLAAMDELWASLTKDESQFESPGWHEKELAETYARYKAGLEKPIPLEEVKRRFQERTK